MAVENDTYYLERHPGETERLGVQNKLFNRCVGYTLHPRINRNLPSGSKIAELATGTGAFLIDVAAELPSVSQLDGYDISDDAFIKSNLPKHMSLSVADARQPAPAELHGRYDAVAIRFMNAALFPEDWKAVAKHAAQLLNPGGALQWIEGDLLQIMTILRSAPEVKTAALERYSHQAMGKLTHLRWFVSNLQDVLTEVGFTDIGHEITSSDRLMEEGRRGMSEICVGAIYSVLRKQAHSKAEGVPTEEEVEKMREEILEEVEGGAYARADMHQFIAWKGH